MARFNYAKLGYLLLASRHASRCSTVDKFFHPRFFSRLNSEAKRINGVFWNGKIQGSVRLIHGSRHLEKDFYDTLGVTKTATSSQIKKAYYGLAKKLHPDTNKDDADAEKKFQEVQKAYEVLKDDEKRSMYDQVGHDTYEQHANGSTPGGPGGPGGFNPFEDIFDFIKGQRRNDVGFDLDVQVSLDLSFMEAVQGCSKTVTFEAILACEDCGGTGHPPGTSPEICKACRGTGTRTIQQGPFMMSTTCGKCGGSGKSVSSNCKSCKGDRVVRGVKTVKIDVPAGIDHKETLKISRNGGTDGSRHGDLYVFANIRRDPVFRREGSDIHVNAVVSFSQAILGGTIQVPTLNGDVVLKVPSGTQPGQKVFLKGKGIRTSRSLYCGNQYVHFNVTIPTNLTQRQRWLIEEFVKEEQGDNDKGSIAAAGASS